MLILAVETSTRTGSIALVEALAEDTGFPRLTIIGETTLNLAETHSSRLMPAIVEDPNGNRAGVGFVIDTPEGQRLIVVLTDGWIGDYALTTRK
jgi:hypothetical protein